VGADGAEAAEGWPTVRQAVEEKLRDRLGVRIDVQVVAPGSLDPHTGAGTAAKLKRFRDER
jgi:hypothetical protein